MQPTQKDIDLLMSRPDLASKFDEVYGRGASNEFVGMNSAVKMPSQKDLTMLFENPELSSKFDEVYGSGSAQKQLGMSAGDVASGAVSNFMPSVAKMVGDVATAVTSPIQTLSGLADLTMGAFQNFTPLDLQKSFGATADDVVRTKQLANQVGQFYKDRYGSVEGAKRAIAQDPAGVMADVATVFTGGAALPGRAGAIASKTASIVDPLSLTAKGVGAAYKGAGAITKPLLGMSSGVGIEPITQAVKAGKAGGETGASFVSNLRGQADIGSVLDSAKSNLEAIKKERGRVYRANMQNIKGDKTILMFNDLDSSIANALDRTRFKGQVTKPEAFGKVQQAQSIIDKWKTLDPAEFHTPEGFDALKQQIGDILESIPFESKNARASVGDIYNSVKSTINRQAPTYSKTMKSYSDATELIREIERSLSLGKKASADTAIRKLQSIMRNNVNTNYGGRLDLAKELERVGGKEMMPALAGQSLSSITPRGLQGATAIPAAYGASLLANPVAGAATLLASSPRLVGEAAYATGALERKLSSLKGKIPEADYTKLANLLYQSQQPKGLLEQ